MFGFLRPKSEVSSHWFLPIRFYKVGPGNFYDALVKELEARQIPDLKITREEILEGSLVSDRRLYLRIRRERFSWDICAAPFGDGSFFSYRFSEMPLLIRPWDFVALAIAMPVFAFFDYLFAATATDLSKIVVGSVLAPFVGIAAFLVFPIILLWLFRNCTSFGLHELDRTLSNLPFLGVFYQRFVRRETWFREDTRCVSHHFINEAVKEVMEEMTGAAGFKLRSFYERTPSFESLYVKQPFEISRTPPPELPPQNV